MTDKTIEDQIKELVLARLQIMPPDLSISLGSEGEFKRDELIQHVEANDEIGRKITEIQLEYLRLLKEKIIYEVPNNY